MPFTTNNYPQSLKNFTKQVRQKAIEIINSLLEQGYAEARAIAIGTSQAEEWAKNRNLPVYDTQADSNS